MGAARREGGGDEGGGGKRKRVRKQETEGGWTATRLDAASSAYSAAAAPRLIRETSDATKSSCACDWEVGEMAASLRRHALQHSRLPRSCFNCIKC
eukprot:3811000-Pleurochrysis_carterae.AAC.1